MRANMLRWMYFVPYFLRGCCLICYFANCNGKFVGVAAVTCFFR
uniref:Uncharacterized protein n=1 Tax=Arundo donax TaxID=35708 RepID=A0A0A8ZHN3_ARUDO